MLDVHPPHQTVHTWKDYLVHMSTIVLGLLIAISLEQTVEAVHRAHERQELRESLRRDSEKALADAESAERVQTEPSHWLRAREIQVYDAMTNHRSLSAEMPKKPHVSSSLPIDPAWNAAKSSQLLSLLTQEEVQAFSEVDIIFTRLQQAYNEGVSASDKRGELEARYSGMKYGKTLDLSHATPEQLDDYIRALMEEYDAWNRYRVGCQQIRGAETAILAGERDLGSIQKAELQFYTQAPR